MPQIVCINKVANVTEIWRIPVLMQEYDRKTTSDTIKEDITSISQAYDKTVYCVEYCFFNHKLDSFRF